ncbi:MAG: hypothetical protein ACYC5N_06240 [Endomicrobiales bacterium]
MTKTRLFSALLTVLSPLLLAGALCAESLSIETDYRLRGISYPNTDFDTGTSSDTLSYYSQRLQLSLAGKFNQGIEIGARLTALGVSGSTATTFALFPVPYPRTDFTPFVETAYLKITGFADQPIDIIVGKQNLAYGSGLIISDNGQGFTALRLMGNYSTAVPFTDLVLPLRGEIFTAKVKEGFRPESDLDLNGGVISTVLQQNLWEFGYFEQKDFSGSTFSKGGNGVATATKAVVKQFFDLRFERKESISTLQFEIAKQMGYVSDTADNRITLDGIGYVASGELIGEKTKLGRVTAHALIAVFSGDGNPGVFSDDKSFSPDFTRRHDGLEPAGYGELFAATPQGSFFPVPPSYSGINTLNLGMDFSPLYAWTLGADYFLYSASQGPRGAPEASGFERLYGAEFSLGIELDLFVKYVHSKYVESRFSFSRYTPPKYEVFWPKGDPAARYQFDISAKF